jgi:hypothetical protein
VSRLREAPALIGTMLFAVTNGCSGVCGATIAEEPVGYCPKGGMHFGTRQETHVGLPPLATHPVACVPPRYPYHQGRRAGRVATRFTN